MTETAQHSEVLGTSAIPAPKALQHLAAFVGGTLAVLVVFVHFDSPVRAILLGGFVAVCVCLAVIDLREHRLPNKIVGPLALGTIGTLLVAAFSLADLSLFWKAVGVGFLASVVLFVGNLFGGVGMGDVKFAFPTYATAAWFGSDTVTTTLFVTALSGGLAAAAFLINTSTRKHAMSYGPYMALGITVALLLAGI